MAESKPRPSARGRANVAKPRPKASGRANAQAPKRRTRERIVPKANVKKRSRNP